MAQFLRLRLVAAIALYVTSLTLPGLHLEGHDPAYGWDILMRGWLGIAILEIAWISNILFAVALVATLMEKPMHAAYIATAAFLIGLTSLRSTIWVFHHAPLPAWALDSMSGWQPSPSWHSEALPPEMSAAPPPALTFLASASPASQRRSPSPSG